MAAVPSQFLPHDAVRITAPALRRALIAGMRRVIARRESLNKINVFPVPDGDTGSNLAFTLGTVLAGALSRRTAAKTWAVRAGSTAFSPRATRSNTAISSVASASLSW